MAFFLFVVFRILDRSFYNFSKRGPEKIWCKKIPQNFPSLDCKRNICMHTVFLRHEGSINNRILLFSTVNSSMSSEPPKKEKTHWWLDIILLVRFAWWSHSIELKFKDSELFYLYFYAWQRYTEQMARISFSRTLQSM